MLLHTSDNNHVYYKFINLFTNLRRVFHTNMSRTLFRSVMFNSASEFLLIIM